MIHRDEIHGDVRYDPLAVELLNTGALQRLGRVYQLGYGHLIYRGGTHTRLSHALGAYDMAGRLVDALRRNYDGESQWPDGVAEPASFLPRARPPKEKTPRLPFPEVGGTDQGDRLSARWTVLRHLVGWAGLLHDVGHIPLGHTLEDEFDGIYTKHDDPHSPRLRYLWVDTPHGSTPELAQVFQRVDLYPSAFVELGLTRWEEIWGTVFLICTFSERIGEGGAFKRKLEKAARSAGEGSVPDRLLTLHKDLAPWLFSPYMSDIVANTISADYLDYLRRDPHNLGLDVLRDDRVVTRFWIGRDHGDNLRMALSLADRRGKRRLDTCTGVVELVRQRYRFAEIVYYHKTKVAASAMLAKVFHLVEIPEEIPAPRDIPALEGVDDLVQGLLEDSPDARRSKIEQLHSSCLPSALLDPEIGDETLPFLLLGRAWTKFEESIARTDPAEAARALRGISLLAAVVRRSLYKVALTMDAAAYGELSDQSETPEESREASLTKLISSLRASARAREELEQMMIDATDGWPPNSLLLYVPERKSQAKGIETGALADGRVITLGLHPAVSQEVAALNQHYKDLWRLIVFVHPEYLKDAPSLSAAVDVLVAQRAGGDPGTDSVANALGKACWFPYIQARDRIAARRLEELSEHPPNWAGIEAFQSLLEGHTTDEEIASGAALLSAVARSAPLPQAKQLVRRYSTPGSLMAAIETQIAADQQVRSREGEVDATEEVLIRRAAIRVIAQELGR